MLNTMKVILFKQQNIKAKTGEEYVKVPALAENGEMIEIFSDKASFDAHKLASDKFLSEADVKTLFETYVSVDVNFNHRGRLNSIS